MRITTEQLQQHLAGELKTLYTVFGDETLLALEASDRIRARARAEGYTERVVLTADSGFRWNELAFAGSSQSLFATRRVLERTGVLSVRHRELDHVRGYTIQVRRGLLQRMWGAGTLTLSNGVDPALRLVNIPSVELLHEALVDQVEMNQNLAHRDAQPPLPPQPPLPAGR